MESNRRDFLKKSAVAGGLVWAAPALHTVAGAQQQTGTPGGCPTCPDCRAEATGLRALGLTAGRAVGSGCECLLTANLNAGSVGGASSQTVCGSADNNECEASSFVEGLRVRIAANAFLEATVLASCVSCDGTGTSTVADLDLVTVTEGVESRTDLTVTGACNERIAVPGFDLVEVVLNEQFCLDGRLTVRALRVTVAGLDVIAAESVNGGGFGCQCQPCAADPTCVPPTTRLCLPV